MKSSEPTEIKNLAILTQSQNRSGATYDESQSFRYGQVLRMRLVTTTKELHADFLLEDSAVQGGTFALILKSKNGTGYNPDYEIVLEELLAILARNNCLILRISLDSTKALEYPEAERIIAMSFPIQLSSLTDCLELRKRISDSQSRIITKAKSGRGNSHRRIRIELSSKVLAKEIFGSGNFVRI